ncbi:MAG: PqqD family protein [Deltaproteobacteria bacterium]|nr:PqqD family protein [Deltaproteobacteria bacterium]
MFYKRSDRVNIKKVGTHRALYASEQKGIHVLNKTALFVWEVLQDPFTFDELLYMLGQVFEGGTTEMKEDLREILDLFLRYDLVHTET